MRSRLLAAALVTALIGPAMAADTQRGVTDNEVVIGTYTDLSGVTAMWGVNNTNAWRMVFDATNAAGGINGRKIKYIVEDNQYQVPRSVQAANKLINRDNVFIMVANGGTPMNNARAARQGRAEHLPADLGALDVRAAASPEVRPGRVVLRSDAFRR
jgi:branched-chain amino acid transport system substrate-binding protein